MSNKLFLFEWWGGLRPAYKYHPGRGYFRPLVLGLWIKFTPTKEMIDRYPSFFKERDA